MPVWHVQLPPLLLVEPPPLLVLLVDVPPLLLVEPPLLLVDVPPLLVELVLFVSCSFVGVLSAGSPPTVSMAPPHAVPTAESNKTERKMEEGSRRWSMPRAKATHVPAAIVRIRTRNEDRAVPA